MRVSTSWDSTSAANNGRPLIKPSKAAQRQIRNRLREETRSLRGTNAHAVVKKLNPIIRGWANYYRTQVSSEVFDALDQHLWRLTYKWASYSHQNKPKTWVVTRYWSMFNKSRQDRWVFGDRQTGAYLHKFAWTRILRHRRVDSCGNRPTGKSSERFSWFLLGLGKRQRWIPCSPPRIRRSASDFVVALSPPTSYPS